MTVFRWLSIALLSAISVQAADRPNIVWLISEDNSKHYLKLFDPMGTETPQIAALAKSGIVFENAFSNAPVCSVARTTLITGCYAPRIFTQFHRRQKMVPMPKDLRMFPAYLRNAGYYTTNKSKTDYNAVPGQDVWDESSKRAHWRNRKAGQPFFHKQSFANSHESRLHFTRRVMENTKTRTAPDTVQLAPYHPDTRTFRYTYAAYHDRIKDVDAMIGNVVSELKKDGVLEDTFLFYFGDHGGVLPRSKGYAYESGLHVPLVVRIPENFRHLVDAKPGTRAKGFVEFVDFGPTALHLAGINVPEGMDGQAFLGPDIKHNEMESRKETLGYADRFDEKYDFVRTLRSGRFKYHRNYQPYNFDALHNDYRYKMLAYREWRTLFREKKLTPVQSQFFRARPAEALYDIRNDPHETNNLAEDPRFRETVLSMRNRLGERLSEMPDLSFIPEPVLVREAAGNPVAYGKQHRARITEAQEVANLQLLPFEKAEPALRAALKSPDPLVRYWACIAAAAHGKVAAGLRSEIRRLADNDSDPLVRVRAAEYLGLSGVGDPRPPILEALKMSDSETMTNLILNSAVMLRDGEPKHRFTITDADVKHGGRYVVDRVAYLNGKPSPRRK